MGGLCGLVMECAFLPRRRLSFQGLGGSGVSAPSGSPSSSIRGEIQEPNPGITSMGGRLVFSTSDAGTTNLADRMIIDNKVRALGDPPSERGILQLAPHSPRRVVSSSA